MRKFEVVIKRSDGLFKNEPAIGTVQADNVEIGQLVTISVTFPITGTVTEILYEKDLDEDHD